MNSSKVEVVVVELTDIEDKRLDVYLKRGEYGLNWSI